MRTARLLRGRTELASAPYKIVACPVRKRASEVSKSGITTPTAEFSSRFPSVE